MWRLSGWMTVCGVLWAAIVCDAKPPTAVSDEAWRAAPLGTPPLGEQENVERARQRSRAYTDSSNDSARTSRIDNGQPQNRWRYRFFENRWWYWTADNQWSYFDGRRWTPYRATGEYQGRNVDPALLRLEAKEGAGGPRQWPTGIGASAGGMMMSGTQGTLGGAPSGSFTRPGGVPSAINTSTGTTTSVSGLSGAGRSGGEALLGRGGAATGLGSGLNGAAPSQRPR